MTNIKIRRVEYMPKELEPGILYVAEEYGAAAHLCACGCGTKIRTPLDVTEWSLKESSKGVSLYPSIGNWQQPCQSHYWIKNNEIIWSNKWTKEEIIAGRKGEERRRKAYFDQLDAQHGNMLIRFWRWLTKPLK